MASGVEPSPGAAALHVCPQCNKAFARNCDLNKHAKSHSRPYKCKVPSCKYETLGWPTQKELERHENDKHSACPRTFACWFQPCPYRSKRESNCKQHMEKAHQWEYVRSKSKGGRSIGQRSPAEPETPADEHYTPSVASASLQPPPGPRPGMDFILFDSDQADALGEDDDALYSESYLPWTSPMTRLRKNETFIEMFTQTYNGTADKAAIVDDILVDPMLSAQLSHDMQTQQAIDAPGLFVNDPAIKVESPTLTADEFLGTEHFVSKKRKHDFVEVTSADVKPTSIPSSGGQLAGNKQSGTGRGSRKQFRENPNRRDDNGEGSRHPKKPRISPREDFSDTSMPDIFRFAHPHIYDRDQKEKYSPCHTLHRDISTLVRHLSRPAHRFTVTERFISSFDVTDHDFRHLRAGLCRWCWRSFFDRSLFDNHISNACEKVSKGKREKWRALLETFTPLADSEDSRLHSGGHGDEYQWKQLPSSTEDLPVSDGDDNCMDLCRTPPTSVPSPALPVAGLPASNPKEGLFVPADEHMKLQKEHQDLRESHQQLKQMTQVLLVPYLFQQAVGQTSNTMPKSQTSAPEASKDTTVTSDPEDIKPNASYRDNLVQHMDSQSTDVDVYALMEEMETARQSLSRMNSGFSTVSRVSTIHHVPNSPPPRPAELPDLPSSGCQEQQRQGKHSLTHRPPPESIPDSGYGTEPRRGSLDHVIYVAEGRRKDGNELSTPPPTLDRPTDGYNKTLPGIEDDGVVGPAHWAEGERTPKGRMALSTPSQHSQMADTSLFEDAAYGIFGAEQEDSIMPPRSPEYVFNF